MRFPSPEYPQQGWFDTVSDTAWHTIPDYFFHLMLELGIKYGGGLVSKMWLKEDTSARIRKKQK